MQGFLRHRLDFQVLDLVSGTVDVDEKGDQEGLSARLERTDGIFLIAFSGRMGNSEGTGDVGLEETFDDLARLVLAAVVGLLPDADIEVVRKPGRQAFPVALRDILGNRYEHVVLSALCP